MIRLLIAAGLLQVLTSRPAAAQREEAGVRIHKVNPGDSLELLAAEYYGDRRHKIFLMIENRFDHPRPLKPGERLRIPVSQDITTAEGDTLASLATTYLGDARHGHTLAEFNGLAPDGSLAAGITLSVPLRVTYRATAPSTLRAIALALFADGGKAALLKDYNGLTSDNEAAGDAITVPIYLRVQPSKRRAPDAESAERVRRRTGITDEARRALPLGRASWLLGDFAGVKRALAGLVPNFSYLDGALVAEIGVLLGSAYVAFDDRETARATFAEVLERAPRHSLSAVEHSPKVREVWQQAGGTVASP